MQTNVAALEKKAIKYALKEDWDSAIQVNSEILEKDPQNLNAKVRLGRAYLQTKDFGKSLKMFDEVLKVDPINQIAKRNYELAKSKKSEATKGALPGRSLIQEPGTSTEVIALLTANRVTADKFSYGQVFTLKVLKTKANLVHDSAVVGEIVESEVIKSLNKADKANASVEAFFLKGSGKDIKVLLKSSAPVFRGDKQDIKPYLKKGSIDEPELIVESFDDEE